MVKKRKPKTLASAMDYRSRGSYTHFRISGFRHFKDLTISPLKKINLFLGPNNSGKTTLLEAIYAHAAGHNLGPFSGQIILKRQGQEIAGHLDFADKLINIFYERDSIPYKANIDAKIENDNKSYEHRIIFEPSYQIADLNPRLLGQFSGFLSENISQDSQAEFKSVGKKDLLVAKSIFLGRMIITSNGKTKRIDVNFPPKFPSSQPFKLANMTDILSHREIGIDTKIFGNMKRYGILNQFVDELKKVFCEIKNIDIIPYPDGSIGPVYIETIKDKYIPLYAFGDGMRRWFHLIGHMIVYKNAVHCIEEIDVTFHKETYNLLSSLIVKYTHEYNNQLFLTSHNLEFSDSFLNALYGKDGCLEKEEDPVQVFTLTQSEEGDIDVWSLSGREAYEKRFKYNLELRG